MRKRERDEVAVAARRRLEALSAELADLHPAPDASEDRRSPPDGLPVAADVSRRMPPGPPGPTRPPQRPPGPARSGRAAPAPPHPASPSTPDELESNDWSFLDEPEPVLAGPPAGLRDARAVIHTPLGRPLPPDPARVPPPGRHAVDHRVASGDGSGGGSVPDWLDQHLPDAVRGRVSLSGAHLKLLSGVLGVALVLAGWLALRSGSQAETVPQAEYVAHQSSQSAADPASSTSSKDATGGTGVDGAGAGTSAGDVVVDVIGKVRHPGIVTLPSGSRVNDAVLRAGGVRPGAHTAGLNLARVLVDGEQIVVGQPAQAATGGAVPGGVSTTAPTGSSAAGAGGLVNLNTADLTQLDTLPGVGPVTAQKIVDWRTAHGAFSSIDELLEVDGIGDKTLADIAPRATL